MQTQHHQLSKFLARHNIQLTQMKLYCMGSISSNSTVLRT